MRVGVIGTGSMGANHLRIYKKLSHLCDVAGIYDADPDKCQWIQETYGAACCASCDRLLSEVDAASIVAPTAHHYEIAKNALQKGVHILLEKPITQEVEQGEELVRIAEESGRILQVGHIERFNPAVELLPGILRGKKVIALEFRRMSPYDPRVADIDVVQDLMIHDIDVMRYILPGEIESIQAVGASPRSGSCCDYAVAILRLQGGVVANFTASRVTEQKIRKACITTDEAYIELDYNERKIIVVRSTRGNYDAGSTPAYRQESVIEKVFVPNHEPLVKEIESFLESVAGGMRPAVDGSAGVQALKTVKRIQASMACGGACA